MLALAAAAVVAALIVIGGHVPAAAPVRRRLEDEDVGLPRQGGACHNQLDIHRCVRRYGEDIVVIVVNSHGERHPARGRISAPRPIRGLLIPGLIVQGKGAGHLLRPVEPREGKEGHQISLVHDIGGKGVLLLPHHMDGQLGVRRALLQENQAAPPLLLHLRPRCPGAVGPVDRKAVRARGQSGFKFVPVPGHGKIAVVSALSQAHQRHLIRKGQRVKIGVRGDVKRTDGRARPAIGGIVIDLRLGGRLLDVHHQPGRARRLHPSLQPRVIRPEIAAADFKRGLFAVRHAQLIVLPGPGDPKPGRDRVVDLLLLPLPELHHACKAHRLLKAGAPVDLNGGQVLGLLKIGRHKIPGPDPDRGLRRLRHRHQPGVPELSQLLRAVPGQRIGPLH